MKRAMVFGLSLGFGAALAVLGVRWIAHRIEQKRQLKAIEALGETKTWPKLESGSQGFTVWLTTAWRDNALKYRFWVLPLKPELYRDFEAASRFAGQTSFTVRLLDASDFEACRFEVEDLARSYPEQAYDRRFVLESKGVASNCPKGSYGKAQRWSVSTGFDVAERAKLVRRLQQIERSLQHIDSK